MITHRGYKWRLVKDKLEYRDTFGWRFIMDQKAVFALEAYALLTKARDAQPAKPTRVRKKGIHSR